MVMMSMMKMVMMSMMKMVMMMNMLRICFTATCAPRNVALCTIPKLPSPTMHSSLISSKRTNTSFRIKACCMYWMYSLFEPSICGLRMPSASSSNTSCFCCKERQ